MTTKEFMRIIKTFTDPGESFTRESNRMVFSVNGQVFDITICKKESDIYVVMSDGVEIPAIKWIVKNLVHLDLLAERILGIVKTPNYYIDPSIEVDLNKQERYESDNPIGTIEKYVDKRSILDTNILYIVSDAGQGKTTLLSKVAIDQAKRYKNKESDWLLVPISLGGRTFLRFDDVTVGVLQNTLRFPYLYYDSFLELIKMGLIVPAYDGFEEMFVENTSDDAFSAVKNLVSSLESQGTIIISARKAYFDFEDQKLGEQIIDNLNSDSVIADKITVKKWDKNHFVAYAEKRENLNGAKLFDSISKLIPDDHPILTRPVFVKKLFDICNTDTNEEDFISKVQTASTKVIKTFISTIIERENNEKWLDKTGSDNIGRPLLTITQHFGLLSEIAQFMWDNKKDSLDAETMDFIVRYYSDKAHLSNEASAQISKRLLSHALIMKNDTLYSFEHDSFRFFFLGYKLANILADYNSGKNTSIELRSMLNRGILPVDVIHSMMENQKDIEEEEKCDLIQKLVCFYKDNNSVPYVQENISNIVIRLSSGVHLNIDFSDMSFSTNALKRRELFGIKFNRCTFMPSSFEGLKLTECSFTDVSFEQITIPIIDSFTNENSFFSNCRVVSMVYKNNNYWDPATINLILSYYDLIDSSIKEKNDENFDNPDKGIIYLQKLGKYLLRSTNISDNWLLTKFGTCYSDFKANYLPQLQDIGLFHTTPNHGSGNQTRYKLSIPLHKYMSIVEESSSFAMFIDNYKDDSSKNQE